MIITFLSNKIDNDNLQTLLTKLYQDQQEQNNSLK